MKNLFVILTLLVSSITLFSCTTDEIAEDLNEDIIIEEVAIGNEGHVADERDDD